MKPIYQKLQPSSEQSFIFYEEEQPRFTVPWHYHPEIEILLVVKSTGTSYIGDSVRTFGPGDVCLIGEGLPHWWKSDNKYLEEGSSLKMTAHVIQFREDLIMQFNTLPEMAPILSLLERSKRGICFTESSKTKIGKMIRKIFHENGLKRISGLLLLLEAMSNEENFEYLASSGYSKNVNTSDFDRFNAVYEYIIKNFQRPITLEEISCRAFMTPSAFCRYFKKRTGKSFSVFLYEFRIGHANRLLAETDIKISTIAHECGFNNLSNFNQQFKKVTGYTPQAYRSKYKSVTG
jgi:AraC-like DNA-binding protein